MEYRILKGGQSWLANPKTPERMPGRTAVDCETVIYTGLGTLRGVGKASTEKKNKEKGKTRISSLQEKCDRKTVGRTKEDLQRQHILP